MIPLFIDTALLGGYLIKQINDYEEDRNKKPLDLLLENINEYEGPLIDHDSEENQKKIDSTCKKLYKFIRSESSNKSLEH